MKQTLYPRSMGLWKESGKYIVPGSMTISKHPKLYTFGSYPIYIEKGKGAKVTDVDGNEYIDFQGALGALVLGIAYPACVKAVKEQAGKGMLYSLSSTLPIQLAKTLTEIIPSAERVRILRNGSDATSAAVRIARAYTGRTKVLSCHFHGWHDWFYITTNMNRGIPTELKNDIHEFVYNDIESLKKMFVEHEGQIAAVIMEPAHLEEPKPGFLEEVREVVHAHGAILIFDEVVTGFRFGLGGAQQYFGVTPDITCLAKALGNGAPISAVVGKARIMDETEDVVTSMTYGEEMLSLAASLATLDVLRHEPVAEHIWRLGSIFKERYNKMAAKYGVATTCVGYPCRLEIGFADSPVAKRLEAKAFFLQETAKRGMLFGNMVFITYSHTEQDIERALAVCDDVLKQLSQAKSVEDLKLQGDLPKELW